MATSPQPGHLLRFGVFEMNLTVRELRKRGIKIRLQEQPFTILTVLAMRFGELVTRDELYSKLPTHGAYDAKHGLNNAIQKIREALDDSAETPRFIQTIPNRGYRFLLPVESIPDDPAICSQSSYFFRENLRLEVSRIRQEFLSASSERALTLLLHHVNGLIDRQSGDPGICDAYILRGEIESALDYCACSEQNRMKHRISLETAAKVFKDPQALSLNEGSAWHTMGRVWRGRFSRPVLLMVSHYVTPGQNGQEDVRITSARKATRVERKAYEQAAKKKRQ